jgi:hypothetical protein
MLEATKPHHSPDGTPVNPALEAESRIARIAVTVFPILVVVAGILGFLLPGVFKPMAPSVPYLLGIIMFCMADSLLRPYWRIKDHTANSITMSGLCVMAAPAFRPSSSSSWHALDMRRAHSTAWTTSSLVKAWGEAA